jgi:hypothetical protein
MNKWTIESKGKVGPFGLGMTTNEVTAILGSEYEVFKRVPDAPDTIYAYDTDAVQFTCTPDGAVKIISVFRPNLVSYRGVQLLGRPLQDVVNELEAKETVTEKEDAGYWVSEACVLLVEVEDAVDGIELYSE